MILSITQDFERRQFGNLKKEDIFCLLNGSCLCSPLFYAEKVFTFSSANKQLRVLVTQRMCWRDMKCCQICCQIIYSNQLWTQLTTACLESQTYEKDRYQLIFRMLSKEGWKCKMLKLARTDEYLKCVLTFFCTETATPADSEAHKVVIIDYWQLYLCIRILLAVWKS